MTASRTRWAAFGAAVAVSLGAGGLSIVGAAGSPGEVSTSTNITPCRLADTRPGTPGIRATPLGPTEAAVFDVRGTNGNCTIPVAATAIVANITAFNASTNTFITAYRADIALPLAALTNVGPNQLLSNTGDIELSPAGKMRVYNEHGTVDIVIDVTGYHTSSNLDDRYAQKSTTYTKTEVDAKVTAATYTDAEADARIAATTYTQAEVDAMIAALPVAQGWYEDSDGDGYGQSFVEVVAVSQPAGYVSDNTDCDDGDPLRNPGATEVAGDRIDNDCDQLEDWLFSDDVDGDNWGGGNNEQIIAADVATGPFPYPAGQAQSGDCDDSDPSINPFAYDPVGDGIDQNCNGIDG